MSNNMWSNWIDWHGGKCPLPYGTIHQAKDRSGDVVDDDQPETWDWGHHGFETDIIAYRYQLPTESGISEPDEDECIQLAYERMSKTRDGQKFDNDKPMMDLIPPYIEEEVAKVLTFGAQKYAPGNWRKVEPLRSRYLAASQRHINALKKGEQTDPESGLHHAAHAICCLMFLAEVELEQ